MLPCEAAAHEVQVVGPDADGPAAAMCDAPAGGKRAVVQFPGHAGGGASNDAATIVHSQDATSAPVRRTGPEPAILRPLDVPPEALGHRQLAPGTRAALTTPPTTGTTAAGNIVRPGVERTPARQAVSLNEHGRRRW